MRQLVRPQAGLYEAWSEAHREWGPGFHEDGFGIEPGDELDDERGFRDWIDRVQQGPGDLWWVVENGHVLGGVALRSAGDERVARSGHLGYGVRPSARGRGVASWALTQVLAHAVTMGIDPVLAVCRADNVGSVATLEHCGAVLVRTEFDGSVRVRRYALAASH